MQYRWIRRQSSAQSYAVASAVALLLATSISPAQAQEGGEFSVQRFEPVPGPHNYLTVAGGRTAGRFAFSTGLFFDYARNPFSLKSCVSETNCDDPNAVQQDDLNVVRDLLTWSVLGSLTPVPRVQIGLRFPLMLSSGQGLDEASGGASLDGISAFGVGDPSLEGKFRILGEPDDPVVFAAAADIKAPLGHATAPGAYIGDETPFQGGIRGILDFKVGPAMFGGNLRGVFKKNAKVGSASLGPELRWGVAAAIFVGQTGLNFFAEGFGSTRFSSQSGTNGLEIDGGIRYQLPETNLILTAAGGPGVIQGIGVPTARGIFGITFFHEASDEDDDGVDDRSDRCPTKKEDRDGVADDDGCPEEDGDHDKIIDEIDRCPNEPETYNKYKDDDGCPDSIDDNDGDGVPNKKDKCPNEAGTIRNKEFNGCPDKDRDGVADKVDKCPDEPEDTDGYADTDGCPDEDNDGDGIVDKLDECSDEPEVFNDFKDEDGCPDEAPDEDGDGITDAKDQCPDKAELLNGNEDTDGCPEFGPAFAEVSATAIKSKMALQFKGDELSGRLARQAVDAIAGGLLNHGEVFLVRVAVSGNDQKLAAKRAQSIAKRLQAKGVKAKRLQVRGTKGVEAVRFQVLWSTKVKKTK